MSFALKRVVAALRTTVLDFSHDCRYGVIDFGFKMQLDAKYSPHTVRFVAEQSNAVLQSQAVPHPLAKLPSANASLLRVAKSNVLFSWF